MAYYLSLNKLGSVGVVKIRLGLFMWYAIAIRRGATICLLEGAGDWPDITESNFISLTLTKLNQNLIKLNLT